MDRVDPYQRWLADVLAIARRELVEAQLRLFARVHACVDDEALKEDYPSPKLLFQVWVAALMERATRTMELCEQVESLSEEEWESLRQRYEDGPVAQRLEELARLYELGEG